MSTNIEYFYDGANCIAETDGAGSLKAVYVYGIELISKKDTQGTLYYLYDAIGNTVATTDSSGDIVARYSYDAFGKIRSQTPVSELRNKNLFVGGYGIVYDDEDELHYMRARYYDSETGRFISRDPIRSYSDYIYCNNNPINSIDPMGLCEEKETTMLDDIQTIGDIAGFYPGIGDVIDLGNALMYLLRGKYVDSTASSISAVPLLGSFIGGGIKVVKSGVKVTAKVNKYNHIFGVAKHGFKKGISEAEKDAIIKMVQEGGKEVKVLNKLPDGSRIIEKEIIFNNQKMIFRGSKLPSGEFKIGTGWVVK
jgi:RHS repeat-associated protein